MVERSVTPPASRVPRGRRQRGGCAAVIDQPQGRPRFFWAVVGLVALLAVGAVLALVLQRGSRGVTPLSTLGTNDYHALAFSPKDPNIAFFGHHNGILKTTDGGRTWQPIKSQRNWDAMGLAIPQTAPDTIYAAGHDIFFKSSDGGQTWEPVQHNLPGTDIHGFAADPDDPQILYAFVAGMGLYQSRDGGSTWRGTTTPLPQSTMALAVLPGNPKSLIAGNMESGLLRSVDGGASWTKVSGGFLGNAVMALATAPQTPGLVYAGSEKGLFRSSDGGLTWTRLGLDRHAMALAVSPQDQNLLLVVDNEGRVYRSQDGGASWGGS